MKKLLILVGPQGSGNHLFTKTLLSNPNTGGWRELLDEYWLGHHTEPFARVWAGKEKLSKEHFEGYDQWVTSVSAPFIYNNEETIPDIHDFLLQTIRLSMRIEVQIAFISRDINILKFQQARVRVFPTLDKYNEFYRRVVTSIPTGRLLRHYFSHEALVQYGMDYVYYIHKQINFLSSDYNDSYILDTINTNANKKYIKNIEEYWLDEEVRKACDESTTHT